MSKDFTQMVEDAEAASYRFGQLMERDNNLDVVSDQTVDAEEERTRTRDNLNHAIASILEVVDAAERSRADVHGKCRCGICVAVDALAKQQEPV